MAGSRNNLSRQQIYTQHEIRQPIRQTLRKQSLVDRANAIGLEQYGLWTAVRTLGLTVDQQEENSIKTQRK
jgi:hypothetical protein